MSLTVTVDRVSAGCFDVRWSTTSSQQSSLPVALRSYSLLGTGSLSQQPSSIFYLVTAASGDAADGREWTVVVRDSRTSALRLDVEQSGIAGTPVMTVRRCRVAAGSVHGDERWTVEPVADDGLARMFSHLSFSATRPTTPSGDGVFTVVSYRARQLYNNISMLFLFPVKYGKLSTGVNATFNASCYG